MTVIPDVKPSGLMTSEPGDLYDVHDITDATGEPMPGEPSSISEVAASVRAAIYAGDYRPGQRLPTREEIGAEHGVSAESAGVALRMLRAEGLVSLEQGRGTFVRKLATYYVRVRFDWQADDDTAIRLTAEINDRFPAALRRQPAVSDLTFGTDSWEWYWQMRVKAADAGRAGMAGIAIAMATAHGAWDLSAASVSAEPEGVRF